MTLANPNNTRKPAGDKPRFKGKSGAQILHEMLIGPHKVDTMFGYPGGAILPVFDQLYKSPAKFILNRHEQASGHCADGYARATGKPGVCIVTSGPGATNTVTPLATAQLDSIPIIVFSGQVATKVIGNDAFQEADVTGITRPCTKWNYLIKDVRELPRVVNEAFMIATSGRPGPVLVDLPKDVTTAICNEEVDDTPREHILKRKKAALTGGSNKQIHEAAELINRAERPLLYVGGGAILSGAHEALRRVADKGNLPCTTTLLGMGAFDEHDPRSLHMLGMHGSAYANYAVQECDCLISVGARFDDRVTGNLASFAPKAKIIHIDIDPSSIAKNVDVDVPVVGDARMSLEAIAELLEARPRKAWFDQLNTGSRSIRLSISTTANSPSRSTSSKKCTVRPRDRPSSPPASVSIRCGRRSSIAGASRGSSSPRADSAPWATACPARWAPPSDVRAKPSSTSTAMPATS
jgi:acetolactate synthase I/II/III large subunit